MRNELVILLIVTICFSAVSSSITFYILSPRASQQFIDLGISSNNALQGFVPNSTLHAGTTLNWTLTVTNRMGSTQFVEIIARIANSTLAPPNITTPATWFTVEIASLVQFVGNGDTANLQFTWTLRNVTQASQPNQVYLTIQTPGQPSMNSAPVGALFGQNFRIIFELWTYDLSCGSLLSTGCFHYGYGPQAAPTGSWLQIWFNAQS
jgi:hypothetical protein